MKQKSLIIFFALILSTSCFCQELDTTIYKFNEIEIPPEFKYKGCVNTITSCEKYIKTNFKMPEEQVANCYSGKIIVQFVIEKDSTISNACVLRGIGIGLDTLVLKTIKYMPKWSPGTINGKTVRSQFLLPVSIMWLNGEENE